MASTSPARSLTEEQIVTAAMELLEKNGAEGLSMRSLASRVQISTMGLYTYFSSKDELQAAIVKEFRHSYDTEAIPGEAWDDTARRLCHSVRDACRNHPELFRLCQYEPTIDTDFAVKAFGLHQAQGMPIEVIQKLWATAEAYIAGFVQHEINIAYHCSQIQNPLIVSETVFDKTPYDDEGFDKGLELIVEGLRTLYHDEQAQWVTPSEQ